MELNTSRDYYNNIVTFVVLHGLKSYDGAMGLAEMLNKKSDINNKMSFVVSSENYKTIQIHKNLEEYLKHGYVSSERYEKAGIEIKDLSSNEILESVKECWEDVTNNFSIKRNVSAQKEFWSIWQYKKELAK